MIRKISSKKSTATAELLRGAPPEYAGQWVAWNKELTSILAHGKTFDSVYAAVEAAGQPDVVFECVAEPRFFIGTT